MGAANQVVIQSFLENRLTVNFRYTEDTKDEMGNPVKAGEAIKVGGVYKTLAIPSIHSAQPGKNVVILTHEDFEAIRKDVDGLLVLGQRGKGLVQLDDIPAGYWDPSQRIAEAEGKRQAVMIERDDALLRVLELEDRVKFLTEKLTSYGWKDE